MSQLQATYKEIWRIGYPLMLGNIAWTLIGMFDTVFMGWLPGAHEAEVAQGAIGAISILYSIFFMIGFGYTRGTQILIARRMGEGNKHKVGEIIDNTIVTMLVSSLVIFFAVQFFSKEFLNWKMSDKEIIAASELFLKYRIWGILASFVSCVFISFYSGIGQTGVLTVSVGLMSLINICLNYVLVFGKFGFPAMGIAGSGLASSIAEWFSVFVMVGGVFIKSRRAEYFLFNIRRVNLPLIWHMTKVSMPLVLQAVIANGAWFFFFTYIERLGQDKLDISSILRQLILVIGIPAWALGSVTNTIVSNLAGQNNFADVRMAIRRISLVSTSLVLGQCLIMVLFPRVILQFFMPNNPGLIEQTIPSLWIISGALALMSFTVIIFNGVVSVGETTHQALYIEIAAVIVYCGYFIFIFHLPGIDLPLVWTAEWVYWITMLAGSVYMLTRKKVRLFF
jgi:putative MATE family efflux protein